MHELQRYTVLQLIKSVAFNYTSVIHIYIILIRPQVIHSFCIIIFTFILVENPQCVGGTLLHYFKGQSLFSAIIIRVS